jgi:hypothetical protein
MDHHSRLKAVIKQPESRLKHAGAPRGAVPVPSASYSGHGAAVAPAGRVVSMPAAPLAGEVAQGHAADLRRQ